MRSTDLSTLSWTTRGEVADRLAGYLRGTGPERHQWNKSFPDRLDVVSLLAMTAGPAQQALLRALALDTRESFAVRRKALWGLARCGVGVSGKCLETLLVNHRLCHDPDEQFGPGDLLALARSRSALRAAQRYLLTLTPEERAELLVDAHGEGTLAMPELVDWLYGRWLNYDRQFLDRSRVRECWNRQVIRCTLSRPTSRAVLQSMWRDAIGGTRDELLDDLQDEEVDWTFPGELHPAEAEELAHALVLPPEVLVARLGRAAVLQMLGALLHTSDRGAPGAGRRRVIPTQRQMRCLHLLRRWKDTELDQWIAEQAIGKRLSPELRWWLMWVLWERNRPLAAAALASQFSLGDEEMPDTFLTWACNQPCESHRYFFREAALPHRRARHQYLALCGLERLGEDGDEWRERLEAWTAHPDPRIQLRALGALARRGNQTPWERLVALAEDAQDLCVRAEAVATLGEMDAARYFLLLRRALKAEESAADPDTAPAAEEAALALARLGTPQARTVLLHAYLHVGRECLRAALEEYLEALLASDDHPPEKVQPPVTNYWRRRLRWKWVETTGK